MPFIQLYWKNKPFGKRVFLASENARTLGYCAGLLLRATPYNMNRRGWEIEITNGQGQRIPYSTNEFDIGMHVGLQDTVTGTLTQQGHGQCGFEGIALILAKIAMEMDKPLHGVERTERLREIKESNHAKITQTIESLGSDSKETGRRKFP